MNDLTPAEHLDSLAHDPNGGTVLTLAFGVVAAASVLAGLLAAVAWTRGWL
jgi:hypothetical protein